jgi:hypothetical protein
VRRGSDLKGLRKLFEGIIRCSFELSIFINPMRAYRWMLQHPTLACPAGVVLFRFHGPAEL